MPVDQPLIEAALDQADRRWPLRDAVAAAIRLDDGAILTGVCLANFNAVMTLCAETEPICAAYRTGRLLVASVCVHREISSGQVTVLAPCGACQERLALWGPNVEVGVADPANAGGWSSRNLLELNPFYWAAAQSPDHTWPKLTEHEW